VQNVNKAANAHGSASFVRIGASLAGGGVAIRGTVAKRTKLARRIRARACRIFGVRRVREQQRR
jgi:hypothetical protein